MPILIGVLLWHLIVATPSDRAAVYQRQNQLLADDRAILANQVLICKALHVVCETRKDLAHSPAPEGTDPNSSAPR